MILKSNQKELTDDKNIAPEQWLGHIEKTLNIHDKNIALRQDNDTVTYDRLSKLVSCARQNLRAQIPGEFHGERPVVAIIAYRSFDLIVAMLAVWLENYVSVVLNPTLSDERLVSEINNAQPFALLSDDTISKRLTPLLSHFDTIQQQHIFSVQGLQQTKNMSIKHHRAINPQIPSLYIAYSSGSTGKPKALLNTKRALQLAIDASIEDLELKPNTNVLLRSSSDFDGFYLEVMMTLMSGATLVIPGSDYLNFNDYQKIFCDFDIHVAILTPTLALPLQPELTQLRTLVLVGEKPSTFEVQRLLHSKKDLRVINGYGLVQDGVCTTMHPCSISDDFSCGVSIGKKAIPGKELLIIDKHGNSTKTGPGQLCIMGDGLAEGYYVAGTIKILPTSQTTLQDNAIKEDWSEAGFTKYQGKDIYKTGEEVTVKNGLFFVTGRLDNQFQIAGQTISPETIEDKIRSLVIKKFAIESCSVFVGPYIAMTSKTRARACIFALHNINTKELNYQEIRSGLDDIHLSCIYLCKINDLTKILTNNKKLNRSLINKILQKDHHNAFDVELIPYCKEMKTSDNKMIQFISGKVNLLLGLDESVIIPIDVELKDLAIKSYDTVELIKSLEDQYQTRLPLWHLPEKLTIESLSRHVANCLVYRKTLENDSNNPLLNSIASAYFIHPVTGTTTDYKTSELVWQLQKNQVSVVYCSAPLLINDKSLLENQDALRLSQSINLMEQADYLSHAISMHSKNNPIYLIGWSFGGTLASEVAERLLKRQHKVEMTVIIDSIAPQPAESIRHGALRKFYSLSLAVAREQLPDCKALIKYLESEKLNNSNQNLKNEINEVADKVIFLARDYKIRASREKFENIINTIRQCVASWIDYSRSEKFKLNNVYLFTCDNDGRIDSPFRSDPAQWQFYCPEIQHTHLDGASHFNVMRNQRFIDQFLKILHSHLLTQNKIVFSSERKIIGSLPVPCHFVGREHQIQTLSSWLESAHDIGFYNLYGLGGSGKTQLLAYFLKKNIYHFPGKVYFLNAESHVSLYASYRKVAEHLQLDTSTPNLSGLVHDVFERGLARWALVYDNVSDTEILNAFNIFDAKECKDSGCMVFFLSRQPIILSRIRRNYMKIDALTSQACETYIKQVIPEDNMQHTECIASLAGELSYFPLAVAQACGYINSQSLFSPKPYTVREYLADYKRKRQEMNLKDVLDDREYADSIAVTWQMTQDFIEKILEQSQKNLSLIVPYLSYLDPDFINSTFLSFLMKKLSVNNPDAGLKFSLEALSSYCVVNSTVENCASRNYSMHRLIQDMIFDRLPFSIKIDCMNIILRKLSSKDDSQFNTFSHNFAERYIRHDELGDFSGMRALFTFFSSIIPQTDVGQIGRIPENDELASRDVLGDDLPLIACLDRMLDRSFDIIRKIILTLKSESEQIERILPDLVNIMKTVADLFESTHRAYQAMELETRSSNNIIKIFEFISDLLMDKKGRKILINAFDLMDDHLISILRHTLIKFMLTLTNISNDPEFKNFVMMAIINIKNHQGVKQYLIKHYDIIAIVPMFFLLSQFGLSKKALQYAYRCIEMEPENGVSWRFLIRSCCTQQNYVKLLEIIDDNRNPIIVNKSAVYCIINYKLHKYDQVLKYSSDLLCDTGQLITEEYLHCFDDQTRAILEDNDVDCKVFSHYFRILSYLATDMDSLAIDSVHSLIKIMQEKQSIGIAKLLMEITNIPLLEKFYAEAGLFASMIVAQQIDSDTFTEMHEQPESMDERLVKGFALLMFLCDESNELPGLEHLRSIVPRLVDVSSQVDKDFETKLDNIIDLGQKILENRCTAKENAVVVHVNNLEEANSLHRLIENHEGKWPDTSGVIVLEGYSEFINSQTDAALILSPELYNAILENPQAFEELQAQNFESQNNGF